MINHASELLRLCQTHRDLLRQMVRRNIAGRYRGSVLGMGWSLLHPVLMLLVYTFVFGVILGARFHPETGETCLEFSLALFAGMAIFNVFSETTTRASSVIIDNTNLVKKVVFPLDLLCIALVAEGLFHLVISLSILLLAFVASGGGLSVWILVLPVLVVPLAAFTLGTAWIVAAIGVFIRDVSQSMGVLMTVLFFMTPILYASSAIPPPAQQLIRLNPLTAFVEAARDILIWHTTPSWPWLAYASGISFLTLGLGYALFRKSRSAFADVL